MVREILQENKISHPISFENYVYCLGNTVIGEELGAASIYEEDQWSSFIILHTQSSVHSFCVCHVLVNCFTFSNLTRGSKKSTPNLAMVENVHAGSNPPIERSIIRTPACRREVPQPMPQYQNSSNSRAKLVSPLKLELD